MDNCYLPRLFDEELDFYLKSVGAIVIVGPKFCGKSTTAARHAKTIVDLTKSKDQKQYIQLALNAPDVFLNLGEKPQLIDEWQMVSFIWNDIKENVSKSRLFGQFILTGSVTDNTKDNADLGERHTGTGRIIVKMMRTFSLFESGDSNGSVSLKDLKDGKFTTSFSNKDIHDYAFLLCRGGWPLAMNQEKDVALQQAKNFYEGLVSADLFSLKDVPLRKDEQRARKLLRSYSRYIGSQVSNEELRKDLAFEEESDRNTFSKYIHALQRLYVIDELEAWNPNLRSKVAIRSKNTRYFIDPSIAIASLGLAPDSLFMDMNTFGFLFENLAIRDLKIYCESLNARLYHYRDKLGREADAVIQFEDGNYALIEIKLCDESEIDLAAKKLINLAKDIDEYKEKPAFMMIITKNKFAYQRDDGVYVVPLACIRN